MRCRQHESASSWSTLSPKSRPIAKLFTSQNAPAWGWFVGEEGTSEELPKTASGKVMKHILRDWSRDLAKKKCGLVGTAGI